jgi:hypothetical protein
MKEENRRLGPMVRPDTIEEEREPPFGTVLGSTEIDRGASSGPFRQGLGAILPPQPRL